MRMVIGSWDSGKDFLDELLVAYGDSGFQQQVAKLARDVRWDVDLFRGHLPKAGFKLQ